MHRSQTGLKKRGRNRTNENNKKDKRLRSSDLKSDGKYKRYGNKTNESNSQRRGSLAELSDLGLDKEDVPEGYFKKRNRVVKSKANGKHDNSHDDKDSPCINNATSSTEMKTTLSDTDEPGTSNKHLKQKPKDKVKDQKLQTKSKSSKEDTHMNSKTSKPLRIHTDETILSEEKTECPSVSKTKKELLVHTTTDEGATETKKIKKKSTINKSENTSPLISEPSRESTAITKSEKLSPSNVKLSTEHPSGSKSGQLSVFKTKTSSENTCTAKKSRNTKSSSSNKLALTAPIHVKEELVQTSTVNSEESLSKNKPDRTVTPSSKSDSETSCKKKLVKDAQSSNRIMVEASSGTEKQAKSKKSERSENTIERSQVQKKSKTKTAILSSNKQKDISPADVGMSSNSKSEGELPCNSQSNYEIESKSSQDQETAHDSETGKRHSSLLKPKNEKSYVVDAEIEPTMKITDKVPANNKKRKDVFSKTEKQKKVMANETPTSTRKVLIDSSKSTEKLEKEINPIVSTKGGKHVKSTSNKAMKVDKKNDSKDSDKEVSSNANLAVSNSSDTNIKNEKKCLLRAKENNATSSGTLQEIENSVKKSDNKKESLEMQKANATKHKGKRKCITRQESKNSSAEADHSLVSGKISSENSSEEGIRPKTKVTADVHVDKNDSTSDEDKSEGEKDDSSDCSEVSEVTERKSTEGTSGREEQLSDNGSNKSEDSTEASDTDEAEEGDSKDQSENEDESSKKENKEEDNNVEIAEQTDEESKEEEMDRSESGDDDDNTGDDVEDSDEPDNDDETDVESLRSQVATSAGNDTGESDIETMKETSAPGSDSNEHSEEDVKVRKISLPKRKPLPSGVKAKLLHIKLGTASEDKSNLSKCDRGSVALMKYSNKSNVESEKPAVKEQMSIKRKGQRSSSRLKAREKFKPELNNIQNHQLLAQTQIIATLRRKQRHAREQLLHRKIEIQHADSQSKGGFQNQEKSLENQQSSDCTISSVSSKNKVFNKNPVKTKQENHKVGVKNSRLVHQSEMSTEKDESAGEKEESPPGIITDTRSACSLSAFRRVTGWLRRVPPKKYNFKERLASVARAIGITDWLFRTFRKRKKRRPCDLKRRTAMRLLSTSRLVNQFNQAPPEKTSDGKTTQESLDQDNLQDTANNQLLEKKIDSSSKIKKLCEGTDAEEAPSTVDAKYAIVFPRIHHLAKTIQISPAVQGPPSNTGQRLVVSVQPATSSRSSKMMLTETKNIQNQQENRPRYRPLQLMECRSTAREGLEATEMLQVPFTSSKNKTGKENQEQSNGQNQTSPVTETAQNDSEVDSSFVDSTQDDEVEQSSSYEAMTHVHWAQNVPGRGDPTCWLSSETLLPRLTIENLSKWTIYQEIPHTKSAQPIQQRKDRWEAEDSTEDMLQMAMKKKQVQDGEDCPEVEKLSDLSFLENVCESAVLLCLKKRFHRDAIYTSIGHMLLSVNPFKSLNIFSLDMAQVYQGDKIVERPPHVFAVIEEAYTLSKISEHAPNILISGHTGSGKTEAVKLIIQYLTTPNMRHGDRPLQIFDFLTILESFGNAKTVLNNNSTRCGQILHMFFQRGALVGCSVTQYLLEKFRVVFQAMDERGFHVFYELLEGLSENEKQTLYLQEPETYYYLNQGRACDLPGKNDKMDFMALEKCLRKIGLSDIELTSIWAVLSAILQLGNICFTSFHSDTYSAAAGFRITEIRIVANLLQISPEGLQKLITERVTRTSYDRVISPLSVEASIDVRDAISQTLYSLLFDWLLEKGNDWLGARETDSSLGIIDVCGFENLGVNSLEQLCRNFANEQILRHTVESLISQEQVEYAREGLCWVPFSAEGSESCLKLLTDRPHGILHILEEQCKLAQATDHTFLQKCHYHHGDNSCYFKPKLPLPVFTLQHYCGPVTYQVHNFLNKNRDRLPTIAREVLAQSRLKVAKSITLSCSLHFALLSDLVKRESEVLQTQVGKSQNKCQESTLTGRFQLTLQELTCCLKRSHTFFVRCISPNPKKLPGIFDVEFVSSQLRNSGILEAVQLMKDGYPIRIPLEQFVYRYGHLAGRSSTLTEDREHCATVLTKIFGDSSALYQIGISKVFLKERARWILQRKWEEIQSLAALTLQKNLRGFLNRKNFQVYRRKITVVQAHVRGRQARQRYRRLKNTRVQFGAVLLISRIPSIHRRICQLKATGKESLPSMDPSTLDVPAELAAALNSSQARSYAQGTRITEVPPPQVKAQCVLSLPPDINNYLLSTFIHSYFKDPTLPPLGQPLLHPLTRVSQKDHGVALELYKLALRFVGNTNMATWQQRIIGNYIVERCLRQPSLTDEVLCQATTLTVQNNNEQQSQRVWLLVSGLLSCLFPSPTLEKSLLKYVSDQGSEGYKAICQSKMLRAQQNEFNTLRSHPLTLLEWTANERKGKMVMDIYTYNEEKYTTEVDSWTTAEQLAGWLLQHRGVGDNPRGWSISILDGNQWLDLCGDDLLLDVIAEVEDGVPSQLFPRSDYPFGDNDEIPAPPPDFAPGLPPGHPSFPAPGLPHGSVPAPPPPLLPPPFGRDDNIIPPAPAMQAPSLPPAAQDAILDEMFSNMNGDMSGSQRMGNYVDQLFDPVFSPTDLGHSESLNRRMKGGGGIGPTAQNPFGAPVYTGMGSMPSYGMPMMNGMMPAMGSMPMMSSMPAMMPQMMPQTLMPQMMPQAVPMPQPMVPSVDPGQLAAQQQAFVQQQALLLAQQMTLQATMLSQQQQQNPPRSQRTSRTRSPSPIRASKPVLKPARSPSPRPSPTPVLKPASKPTTASVPTSDSESSTDQLTAPSPNRTKSSTLSPQVPKPVPQKQKAPVEGYWDEEAESEYTFQKKTFQQKRDFFKKMARDGTCVQALKPPSKILLPSQMIDLENDSDEEPPEPPEPQPVKETPTPKPPRIVTVPTAKTTEVPGKETKKAGGVVKPVPKPKPSREISEIIKMYQNRPSPEPVPFEPVRRPVNNFLKKKDPKEEALARLKMAGLPPSTVSPGSEAPLPPPPPPPPPLSPEEKTNEMSNSIREKQKPLLGLFQSGAIPQTPTVQSPKGTGRSLEDDNSVRSSISKHNASVFFSYSDAKCRLYVRKEIFYPREKFTHPYYLNLLCEQIIKDTYSETGFKLTREERRKMKDFLNEFQVGSDVSSILEESIKKRIVIAARDNWENYFSRLFPVTLDNYADQLHIGVSHRGFRLLKEVHATGIHQKYLKTLCSYSFADILSVERPDSSTLRLSLRNEDLQVYSDHAQALKTLLEIFLQELVKNSNHVVALRSHITDDKSRLQFKRGDIIKVLPMEGLESDWQFGSVGGRSGIFPSQYVQPAAAPDYYNVLEKRDNRESRVQAQPQGLQRTTSKESGQVSEDFLPAYSPPPPLRPTEATHYTMVEFALKYFREAQAMLGWKGMAAEGKKAIELVQHTKVPIQESLIYYTDKELNELATNNFMTLMRFMRDQQYREPDDVKCIYDTLLLCREKPLLRDEIYCQILKQITENPKNESCNRGWTLLSLVTGYFLPTPTLLPCITKYLQDADGTYREVSRNCQEHLRHTLLYHGRQHIPPRKELDALLNGRISRRLVIFLAGGIEYTTKIHTFTVAADLLPEICEQLLVSEPSEQEEFAIFANKNKGEVVRPMRAGDYIHDFLPQDNSVTLEFRRITWKATLRGRSELYIQVHYSQVRHDYMQGNALLLSPPEKLETYTAKVAAVLHRIKGMNTPPDKQELLGYIPSSVQNRLNLQTVQQILLQELKALQSLNVQQAKLQFLETVSTLPLFEYNVFPVKRISNPAIVTPCFVAVNHQELLVLQNNSQQPSLSVNLQDVQSMRTMRPLDSNTFPGVELHYGTAAQPHTLWMELQEAKQLYHTVALIIETQDTATH